MLLDISRPIIFAHRGSSAYAPENTLAAFELAVRQGADAIELDTKLSADGQVVVIHDQTLDRTTSQSGRVRDFTLAEIRKLEAGSHFDIAFKGEPIPTLDKVLEAVGKRIYINIEIANYATLTDKLPVKVAELVKRHKMEERVIFSSFNPLALLRTRRILPEVPTGLLAIAGSSGNWARSWPGRLIHYKSLHPEQRDVTPDLVKQAHQKGHPVFVYTVNRADEMKTLFEMGVDGIFTDDPVLAQQVRKSHLGKE